HEIAALSGMSRQTVRQAIGELEREGLLYRVQGKGTYVAQPQPKRNNADQTIGVMVTSLSDYIFPRIVQGIEGVLSSKGYRMVLCSTDHDKEQERESLDLLLSHSLSGLIVEPTKSAVGPNSNISYFLAMDYERIPYVMINERYEELDCPCVKV